MDRKNDDPMPMTDEEMLDELDRAMSEYFALEQAAQIELVKASEQTLKAALRGFDHFNKLLWK